MSVGKIFFDPDKMADSVDRYPLVTRDEELGTQRDAYLVNGVPQTYFTYLDHDHRPRYYGAQRKPHRLQVRVIAPISNDWQLVVNPDTRTFTVFRTNGAVVYDARTDTQVEFLDGSGVPQTVRFMGGVPLLDPPRPTWRSYGWCCTKVVLLVLFLLILLVVISYEAYVGLRTIDFGKLRL